MASTSVGSIHYDLGLDTRKFDQAMSGLSNKLNSVGTNMVSAGKTMTLGLTLPILAGMGLAIKAASDLNETMNKVDVAFKDQAGTIKEWGNTSLKSMGLAKGTALDAAALFGDMSTAMGLNTKEAAKMSMGLTQLGADLASFKNISFERAQTALAGVYTGETEALKGLGIVMTEANLATFAQSQGIKENIADMTQAEKVQLRYAYVMSVTKNAQGDFTRTFSGTANQMRFTVERMKELQAEMGQRLLPITGRLLEIFNSLLAKFEALSPRQQDLIIKFALVAAAVGPVLIVLGSLLKAIGSIITVVPVLIGLFANPVFLVIAAVLAAIAAAAYLVYRNWSTIKPVVDRAVAGFRVFWATIKPIRDFIAGQFRSAWNDLRVAFEQVKAALAPFGPQLRTLAKIIGGTLVVQIVASIAILAAMAVAIARIIGWIAKFVAALARLISAAQRTALSVNSAMNSIKTRIIGVFASAGSWLVSAGANIIRGLINGIQGQIGSVVSTVKNMANSAVSTVKGILGIRSPSTVFAEIGQNITKGMVQGMVDTRKNLAIASQNLATTAVNNSMSVYGNVNIGNKADADYFFSRQNRDLELASMGLAGS